MLESDFYHPSFPIKYVIIDNVSNQIWKLWPYSIFWKSLEINQQYSSSIIVEHVFVIFLIIQNSKKQQLTEYTVWEMQIIW